MSDPGATALVESVAATGSLGREGIARLLSLSDPREEALLFAAADRLRREQVGDAVYLRGIIEFANVCGRDCLYCGLRRSNVRLRRYRMGADEIVAAAERIARAGIGTVVLQSGEDPFFSVERLCALVGRIRQETGLAITLSVGERPTEEYRAFREAGAERYLLKQETSSRELFARHRPGSAYENRRRCLADLKAFGYEVGTGDIVGLPGQTIKTLADDLLLLKEIDADMLGIGPFIPHPATPLAADASGDIALTLRVLALTRLLTRDTNIPATTALDTLAPGARARALASGANVVMPDFTPPAYRELYELYPGRNRTLDLDAFLERLGEEISGLGRSIGRGSGPRRK